jgi:hypothetical protein
MEKCRLFAVFAAAVILSGCAHTAGGISDSTTPINGRPYVELGNVVGEDSQISLLGLIPISSSNDIQDAIDDAKQEKKADALIEVTVESYGHYWILWSTWTTKVSGKAIKFK